MTFEELTTVLVEIEAIINSRPISPLSSDPNNFEALTPVKAIPELPIGYHDIKHLQRRKRITAAKQQFWKNWSVEYMNDMLHRHQWMNYVTNIQADFLCSYTMATCHHKNG